MAVANVQHSSGAWIAWSAERDGGGLRTGEAPDRLLVGLAVLGLLSEAAEELPLMCLVDDAQWLDQASGQALAFVARRLLAEPVALVFAVREPSGEQQWRGLPLLTVEGLSSGDARALLDSVTPGRLDERVRDRIVAETRGNPLALLGLARGMSAAELAGGFGLPDALPLATRIERSFLRRLESLPVTTQRLLLAAAAEPASGSTRAPAGRPRHVRPVRRRGVRRRGPPGARGDRRDSAQAHRGHARRPYRAGGAGRPAGCRGPHEP